MLEILIILFEHGIKNYSRFPFIIHHNNGLSTTWLKTNGLQEIERPYVCCPMGLLVIILKIF